MGNFRFYFLLTLFVLTGCKNTGEVLETSQIKHEISTPITGSEPFNWSQADWKQFHGAAQAPPFRVGSPLKQDNPLVIRMQAWSDQVHELVKKDHEKLYPNQFVIPRPIINIVPSKEANGWVSGIVTCIDYPVDIDIYEGDIVEGEFNNRIRLSYDEVEFPAPIFGQRPAKCAKAKNWPKGANGKVDAVAFVKFFNKQKAKCKLEFKNDRFRVFGEGCKAKGIKHAKAKQLSIYSASNFIHITTPMVHIVDNELGILTTLVHELAHYYRSHAVSLISAWNYDYWYDQVLPPTPGKPSPAADSPELEKEFMRLMPIPKPEIKGQKYSYYLTKLLLTPLRRKLKESCEGEKCPCTNFVETTKPGTDWVNEISCLGCMYVKKETSLKYLESEKMLELCSQKIPINDNQTQKLPNSIDIEDIQKSISLYLKMLAYSPLPKGKNLGELLDNLNQRAKKLETEKSNLLNVVRKRRLGKYTAEQEADDFSIEYLAKLGFKTIEIVRGRFDQYGVRAGEDQAKFTKENGLSFSDCKDALNSDFLDKTKNSFMYIPLGNLHSPHHGGCYRAYNKFLEGKAHNYDHVFKENKAKEPQASWEDALKAAKEATANYQEIRRPGTGPLFSPRSEIIEKGSLIIN